MAVLVDSSVWIAFFKGVEAVYPLCALIDQNNICVNDPILAELLPSIQRKKETRLQSLLLSVQKVPLTVDWEHIILLQTLNLKHGHNNIGLVDLIIAQNAIQNKLSVYTLDKHFHAMRDVHGLMLHEPPPFLIKGG